MTFRIAIITIILWMQFPCNRASSADPSEKAGSKDVQCALSAIFGGGLSILRLDILTDSRSQRLVVLPYRMFSNKTLECFG